MTNKEKFQEVYERKLREAIANDEKGDYDYYRGLSNSSIHDMAIRMTHAFSIGNANIDNPAAKAACRELGVKFGRKALMGWLSQ